MSHLASLRAAHQVTLIREALAVATPQEADDLAPALIELAASESTRRRDRAAADQALGLIAHAWRYLSGSNRAMASSVGRGRWAGVLTQGDADIAASVRLFESTADPCLTPLVAAALGARDPKLARRAGRAILMAAELAVDLQGAASEHAHDAPLRDLGEDDLAAWIRGIADAAWTPAGARSPGALTAVLMLHTRAQWPRSAWADLDRLERLAAETGREATSSLRQVLRKVSIPAFRAVAWRHLPMPGLAAAAIDRLASPESDAEHATVLDAWWLGLRPARLRALESLGRERAAAQLSRAVPDDASAFTANARIGVAHWSKWIGTDEPARDRLLEPLLSDADPRVRAHAAAEGTRSTQRDLAFDAQPAIARLAFHRWSGVGVFRRSAATSRTATGPTATGPTATGRDDVEALCKAPNPSVRLAAQRERARHDPFAAPTSAARQTLRRRLRVDRARAIERVVETVNAGGLRACAALAHVRTLRLEVDLVETLLRASRSSDHRLAATAIRLLARAPGDQAESRLHACVGAGDTRVRANAIEALAERARVASRSAAVTYPIAIELKGDDAHRVRANAVRALLETALHETDGDRAYDLIGVEALADMLGDHRPGHRAAAGWVVRRCAASLTPTRFGPAAAELIQTVIGIAEQDADAHARHRGRHALRRMRHELPIGGSA